MIIPRRECQHTSATLSEDSENIKSLQSSSSLKQSILQWATLRRVCFRPKHINMTLKCIILSRHSQVQIHKIFPLGISQYWPQRCHSSLLSWSSSSTVIFLVASNKHFNVIRSTNTEEVELKVNLIYLQHVTGNIWFSYSFWRWRCDHSEAWTDVFNDRKSETDDRRVVVTQNDLRPWIFWSLEMLMIVKL